MRLKGINWIFWSLVSLRFKLKLIACFDIKLILTYRIIIILETPCFIYIRVIFLVLLRALVLIRDYIFRYNVCKVLRVGNRTILRFTNWWTAHLEKNIASKHAHHNLSRIKWYYNIHWLLGVDDFEILNINVKKESWEQEKHENCKKEEKLNTNLQVKFWIISL